MGRGCDPVPFFASGGSGAGPKGRHKPIEGFGLDSALQRGRRLSLVAQLEGLSRGALDRALKAAALHVGSSLDLVKGQGVGTWDLEDNQARTGVYRNVRYRYAELPSARVGIFPVISQGVLLEMAIRDAVDLRWETASIEPYVAATARDLLPSFSSSDLEPVSMRVLLRERTLFEKLAHVHQVVARHSEKDAERRIRQIGRHYYDIYSLLGDETTLQSLREPGAAERLTSEADVLSEKAGFPYVPRPDGGFGASPAFDPAHPAMEIVRPSYRTAIQLVFGEAPSLEDCLNRVRARAGLL